MIDFNNFECVTTMPALESWALECHRMGIFSIDTETDGTDPISSRAVGVSLSLIRQDGTTHACYIPFAHTTGEEQLTQAQVTAVLKPIIEDPKLTKILQNAQFDVGMFRHMGIELNGFEDTMLMAYVVHVSEHAMGMDPLAQTHLGYRTILFKDVVREELGMTIFPEVSHYNATMYAAEDSAVTLELYYKLADKMTFADWKVYRNIDLPLVKVLADMKLAGVTVDVPKLDKVRGELVKDLETLDAQITALAGKPIEVGSTQKLAAYLYTELKIDAPVRTKTGNDSTSAEALEIISDRNPVIPLILEHKTLTTLKNVFLAKLPGRVNRKTGRIHGDFMQMRTATARLASKDPNLQNIPNGARGEVVRSAFIARRGHKLIAADYSQIELRVLAQVSGDPPLIQAFNNGVDIHSATACVVHNLDPATFDPNKNKEHKRLRTGVKAVNFGLIYGQTKFGLAQKLNISLDEAEAFIATYFAKLPGIDAYLKRVRREGLSKGYVTTMFGRRLPIDAPKGNEDWKRDAAGRRAGNYGIQGGAADLIRLAMAAVGKACAWDNSKLLMTVHDELIVEAADDVADEVAAEVKHLMEHCADDWIEWKVPIIAEPGVGDTWLEAKSSEAGEALIKRWSKH